MANRVYFLAAGLASIADFVADARADRGALALRRSIANHWLNRTFAALMQFSFALPA